MGRRTTRNRRIRKVQREELLSGRKEDRMFEDEGVVWERCIGRRLIKKVLLNSGGIRAGGSRRRSDSVGRLERTGEAEAQQERQL